MKKWYLKEFANWALSPQREVLSFLNELSYNGIKPEEIKIVACTISVWEVYYYSDKEVK